MTTLYFDCFSGAAGDMILGALIDAGVPFEDVRRALGSLAIEPDTVWIERVSRAGIQAVKFHVRGEGVPVAAPAHQHAAAEAKHHHHGHDHHHHDADHGHEHHHGHPHRPLADIYRMIDGSSLSGAAKDRAKALFGRLGQVEASIHGTTIEKVHLHEVGALDSIIDIVGSVYALEALGVKRVVSSPLNVGSGMVRSAHGLYPVPAPATVRLLGNAPIYAGGQQAELVTPTGALLISSYASAYGPIPSMRLDAVGYGAGSRDVAETPNVLRVLVGEEQDGHLQSVTVLEAEIDDMNPQLFGVLMDRLFAEGALDVFYTPIQMKKNRPGTLLTVLSAPDARDRLTTIVFRETTTIGVRYRDMTRECLERESVSVQTSAGQVRIKVARRGGELMNASPEFDDCVRLASLSGMPVKDVQAAAMKAFLDSARAK